MAANPIPRMNEPRYRTTADQFNTFKARLADAFATGMAQQSFLTRIQQSLGVQLEESTKELKASYPIMLPRAGFEQDIGPLVYKKWSETEVTSTPVNWRDGVSEDLRKHMSPGPSFLRDANAPALWAQAALDTAEQRFCQVLNAGTSGTHGFDSAAFFCALDATTKKINPKDASSRTYGNHKGITLDAADPIAFWEEIVDHFRAIPTPGARGYLKLDPAFVLMSSKAEKILSAVAEKKELRIKVGATEVQIEENRWQGKFDFAWTNELADNEMYVFARGGQAGIPYIVHSLEGIEELFGAEFMAPQDWRAVTGTYLQPLVSMLGPESEHAIKNNEVLVQVSIDFDITPMCPWSVLKVKVTYA